MINKVIFRAKLKSTSLAGSWVYWNVYGELCTENGKRHPLKLEMPHSVHLYYNIIQIQDKIDSKTIGMYSGLSDKDGVKIYDGDICLFENDDDEISFYAIKYEVRKGCFITLERHVEYPTFPDHLDDFFAERCKVVCDIFNPEYSGVSI